MLASTFSSLGSANSSAFSALEVNQIAPHFLPWPCTPVPSMPMSNDVSHGDLLPWYTTRGSNLSSTTLDAPNQRCSAGLADAVMLGLFGSHVPTLPIALLILDASHTM